MLFSKLTPPWSPSYPLEANPAEINEKAPTLSPDTAVAGGCGYV